MKKHLTAIISRLALLALASTTAFAQSSLSIYGVVDLAVMHASGTSSGVQGGGASGTTQSGVGVGADAVTTAPRGAVTSMENGLRNPSKLGLRGREDLGGGFQAAFVIETSIVADGGAGQAAPTTPLFGDRETTAVLYTPWGQLKMGRQFLKSVDLFGNFDALGDVGPGSFSYLLPYTVSNGVNNSIRYRTPKWNGFIASYQYSMSENQDKVAAATSGSQSSTIVTYSNEPFSAQFTHMYTRDYALTETTYQSGVSAARNQRGKSLTMTHLGAAYDFGPLKLGGQIATVRNTQMAGETERTIDAVTRNIGITIPVGDPHLFRINYVTTDDKRINNQDATSWALGYDYALSKRTSFYAGAAWVKNSNGAQFSASIATANALSGVAASQTSAADGRTSAVYSGLSHTF